MLKAAWGAWRGLLEVLRAGRAQAAKMAAKSSRARLRRPLAAWALQARAHAVLERRGELVRLHQADKRRRRFFRQWAEGTAASRALRRRLGALRSRVSAALLGTAFHAWADTAGMAPPRGKAALLLSLDARRRNATLRSLFQRWFRGAHPILSHSSRRLTLISGTRYGVLSRVGRAVGRVVQGSRQESRQVGVVGRLG